MTDAPHPIIDDLMPAIVANVKDNKCITPVFFIGDGTKCGILPANFETNEDKDRIADAAHAIIEMTTATYVVFVSEVWMKSVKKDDTVGMAEMEKGKSIANDPESEDALMISFESKDGTWSAIIPILPGRVLGEVKWKRVDGQTTGRFTNFFNKPTMH